MSRYKPVSAPLHAPQCSSESQHAELPTWLTSTVGSLGDVHGGQPHCAMETSSWERLDVVLGTGCSGDTGGRGPVGPGGLGGFPTLTRCEDGFRSRCPSGTRWGHALTAPPAGLGGLLRHRALIPAPP